MAAYGIATALSALGIVLLSSAIGGYVDKECTSRYEIDFDVPRDAKGRPNFKFDFTPGEGKPPQGIDAEE
jgi:hypothetical protein